MVMYLVLCRVNSVIAWSVIQDEKGGQALLVFLFLSFLVLSMCSIRLYNLGWFLVSQGEWFVSNIAMIIGVRMMSGSWLLFIYSLYLYGNPRLSCYNGS